MILSREHIQRTVQEFFTGKPVKKVWLFGSYARGEANESSDVDFLVDIDDGSALGLKYFSWREELASLLNKKVDVVSVGWENQFVKPFIDKDKSIIYER